MSTGINDANQSELAHRVNYPALTGNHEHIPGQFDLLTGEDVSR